MWVTFTRKPALEGEELVKAKKKLKGDQLKMTNPVDLIAFLPLNELRKLDVKEVLIRAPFSVKPHTEEPPAQPLPPTTKTELPDNTPIDYHFDSTYIKLRIVVSKAFHPEISDYQLKISDLMPKPPAPKRQPRQQMAINAFKSQLQSLMPLLGEKYLGYYGDDLKEEEEKARGRVPLETNNSQRRAAEFLGSLAGSELYEKIKNDMLPAIRSLVKNCLAKETDIIGFAKDETDGVYTKIFEMLSENGKQAIEELADTTKDVLGSKVIISPAYSKDKTYEFVQQVTGEDKKERFTKLSIEYEKYGMIHMAINRLKVLIDEGHLDILNRYVDIELKNKNLNVVEDYLLQLLSMGNNSLQVQFRLLGVYLSKNMFRKALIVSKHMEDKSPGNLEVALIRHYLYKNFFNSQPQLATKYFEMAKRFRKRQLGLVAPYNQQGTLD